MAQKSKKQRTDNPPLERGSVSYRPVASIVAGRAEGPLVVLGHDFDRYSTGVMAMTITDVVVQEGKKEVGHIGFEIGGCAVTAFIGGRMWSIDVKELWPLFAKADAEYLKEVEK